MVCPSQINIESTYQTEMSDSFNVWILVDGIAYKIVTVILNYINCIQQKLYTYTTTKLKLQQITLISNNYISYIKYLNKGMLISNGNKPLSAALYAYIRSILM